MLKRFYKKLIRWWRLTFKDYYNPFFKSSDGVQYARLQSGVILRLEGKGKAKKRKKLKELADFFKVKT